MIPGNIDLTENLDFRKVVKKELPQLPASWKESDSKINFTTGNNIYTYTTSSTYNITYRNLDDDYQYLTWNTINDYTVESNTSYTISAWLNNGTTRGTTIQNITYYNDYNEFEIGYTISEEDLYDDLLYLDHKHKYKSWSSLNKKVEYDVFGNKKVSKEPEYIPSKPFNWRKKSEDEIEPIPWKYRSNLNYYFNDDEIESIPWKRERNHRRSMSYDDPGFNRAMGLICWLMNKSSSFIRRYFDEEDEKKTLSYLTNMSWIRVHDAVID